MSIVIKYGGNAMTSTLVRRRVALEIRTLAQAGRAPVVVHGGGPFIQEALAQAGVKSTFVRGLRVTTPESLPVIEMVLTRLSKCLAQDIGHAVGLTGRDDHLLVARRLAELGLVGEVTHVNTLLLTRLLALPLTPVVACLAENETGDNETGDNETGDDVLNVNADSVAGAVAGALSAPVVFLTDVAGVLGDVSDARSLLPELSREEVLARVADGRISGGMIPKVEAALEALGRGAPAATIADGRVAGQLALALAGRAGTRLVP